MKALIFAAGLGTRLKPITDSLPKALVPICGKPLIEHVLSKLEVAGFDDFVVNVHHFADKIEAWFEGNHRDWTVAFSDERDSLRETGGGIRHAQNLLCSGASDQPFLVHNVDIISNLDLSKFISQIHPWALATLVVSERKTSRYLLFDDDMKLVGWTNVTTGEVKSPYGAIDPSKYHQYAFAGIHLISPMIFKLMEDWPEKFSIIDFYLSQAASHDIYGWVPEDFKMIDVGKLDSLKQAESLCRNL